MGSEEVERWARVAEGAKSAQVMMLLDTVLVTIVSEGREGVKEGRTGEGFVGGFVFLLEEGPSSTFFRQESRIPNYIDCISRVPP